MPSLFYLPKVSSLPGSKLYFYQTGTATPQPVYTDVDLQIAHVQPVEADIAGVFAPIYLDPTLPEYRVTHHTSADVLIYTVDDIPSNQNTTTGFRITDTTPDVVFFDTDGTSGQRKFRIRASGNGFEIQALNEAENVATTFLAIEGGLTQRLVIDDTAKVDSGGTEYPIAFSFTGTYQGTLTGFSGTDPTGTITYSKVGTVVVLNVPSAGSGLSGTSDATSMTITGMPASIRPSAARICAFPSVGDNSLLIGDGEAVWVEVGTDGVITFNINGSSTGFTASGVKGTGAGGQITYLI
jgi:hypothetical protein